MSKAYTLIDRNVTNALPSFIITANGKEVKSIQKRIEAIITNTSKHGIIVTDSSAEKFEGSIKSIQLGKDFNVNEVETYITFLHNKILKVMGVNHVDYEKKERLVTNEVETGAAEIQMIQEQDLQNRKYFIDKLNTKPFTLGAQVTVELNVKEEKSYDEHTTRESILEE